MLANAISIDSCLVGVRKGISKTLGDLSYCKFRSLPVCKLLGVVKMFDSEEKTELNC